MLTKLSSLKARIAVRLRAFAYAHLRPRTWGPRGWALTAALVAGTVELVPFLDQVADVAMVRHNARPASGQVVIVDTEGVTGENLTEVLGSIASIQPRSLALISDDTAPLSATRDTVPSATEFIWSLRSQGSARVQTTHGADPAHEDIKIASRRYLNDPLFQMTWDLPFVVSGPSGTTQSLSAALVQSSKTVGSYRLDYSISARTIPRLSARTLSKKESYRQLRNKIVIVVDSTAEPLRFIPPADDYPEIFVHAIGAETLLAGGIKDWGWLPLIGLIFVVHALRSRQRSGTRARLKDVLVWVAALSTCLIAPLYVYGAGIRLAPGPTVFGLIVMAGVYLWRAWKQSATQHSAATGLPNFTYLVAQTPDAARVTLIVARVPNYSEILATLPEPLHIDLARQIERRIHVGWADVKVAHDEQGAFAWTTPVLDRVELEDALRGLRALFNDAVRIGSATVDTPVAFGIDTDNSRPIAQRLASATMVASEAAQLRRPFLAFEADRLDDAAWRLSMHSAMDTALENGEIWVAFQPQLDLSRNVVASAEALVRWTHPERGAVPPDVFVRHAEESGRIDRLSLFVLREALTSARQWLARNPQFSVAVNMSAIVLDNPQLKTWVADALSAAGVPASALIVEITETASYTDRVTAMRNIGALRAMGVRISIDDFATGNGGMLYLKSIPSDELKIDRAFVGDMADNPVSAAVVGGISQMARMLKRRVVAEGVEDSQTLRLLRQLGCDFAQGYYIGRPMRADDLTAMLDRNAGTAAA